MKTTHKRGLMALLALTALLLVVAWMAGVFRSTVAPGLQEPPVAVDAPTVTVRREIEPVREPVPGTVRARQATLIASRILAGITAVHVRAGDTVTQGQLLVELEQADWQSRASQARERIRAIEARREEADRNLTRIRSLHAQGLVAAAALDKARADAEALDAELARARQALKEAETAVGFTEIRSPLDGRVVERFAEPGDTAQPGSPLLSLYNPLSLRVEAQVREQLALSLRVGQTVDVEIPARNLHLSADIEERVPAADPGSRSFRVKARLARTADLLPGMFARLWVPAGQRERLLIPAASVARVGQLDVVWVRADDGTVQRRFVRLGEPRDDGRVEVRAGLEAGEAVLAEAPR